MSKINMDIVEHLFSALVQAVPTKKKKIKIPITESKKAPYNIILRPNIVNKNVHLTRARQEWLTNVFLDIKKTLKQANKFDDTFTPAWWLTYSNGTRELNKQYKSVVKGTYWDFWSFSDRLLRVFDGMVRLGYLTRIDTGNKGKSRMYIVNI